MFHTVFSGIPKPKRAKNENEKVLWIMTPTTKCDGYFQNSLQPISYLSFIWNLYILGLKKQPNTQNHAQETYSANVGVVLWPKIPQMAQFVKKKKKVWIPHVFLYQMFFK